MLVTNVDDVPELGICLCSEKYTLNKEEDCEVDEEFMNLNHEELRNSLLNLNGNESLPRRFRALFALRNLADERAVTIISECKERKKIIFWLDHFVCLLVFF